MQHNMIDERNEFRDLLSALHYTQTESIWNNELKIFPFYMNLILFFESLGLMSPLCVNEFIYNSNQFSAFVQRISNSTLKTFLFLYVVKNSFKISLNTLKNVKNVHKSLSKLIYQRMKSIE